MIEIRKSLRTLQVRFPSLLDFKFSARRAVLNSLRQPFERDFAVLGGLRLRPGESFIDVGANRGQSIDAIRLYHPHSIIESFEPNPVLCDRLRKQTMRDPNVRLHQCGLGDEQGEFELFIPSYGQWEFDGLASFKLSEAKGWLSPATMYGFDPEKLNLKRHTCQVLRLDDLDLRPGFIKIDVQGFERQVVLGGLRTIREYQPIVLMENNMPEVDALDLLVFGYHAFHFDGTRLVEGVGSGLNSFYIHPSRMSGLDIRRH